MPAMVAKVADAAGELVAIHVTFLRRDGNGKAEIERPKRMFGSPAGGAVRLDDDLPGDILAFAEGIESALSYRQLKCVPAWACLSTIGLERVEPPPGLSRAIIAGDGDEAGRKAAHALKERLSRRCAVALDPAPEGHDWNDLLGSRP